MRNMRVQMWPVRFAVSVGVVLAAACQHQAGEGSSPSGVTEWKFALEEIQGSVQDAYAQKFKELIEQKSGGAVTVTVYPYGSLGTSDHVTELIHMGALQFAMASPGHLGKIIPELQLFLLHFIFSDDNEVNKRVLGNSRLLRDQLDRLYREKGLQFLTLYPEGWQVWTTKKQIRQPADFAGLKMRVMTAPMLISAYKAYGANPTPLPYAEVYSALQLNMIDGQVNPIFAIEEMSFYEVTDYLIFPKHAQFVTSVVTNPDFFSELSSAEQEMIWKTLAELHEYIFAVQAAFNAERLQTIQDRRPELQIVHLTAQEREAFRRASLPVRQEYVAMAGSSGRELLDTLLQEVTKAEQAVANGVPPASSLGGEGGG